MDSSHRTLRHLLTRISTQREILWSPEIQEYRINRSGIDLGDDQLVGEGKYGTVLSASLRSDGSRVVVKKLRPGRDQLVIAAVSSRWVSTLQTL